jgi:hypothetical protein
VEHSAPGRRSLGIIPQLAGSIVNPMPMAVSRYSQAKLRQEIDALIAAEHYDSIVCDFLAAAPNLTDLGDAFSFSTMLRRRSGSGTSSSAALS